MTRATVAGFVATLSLASLPTAIAETPENLALRATVSADSEYNAGHAAIRINDGKIAEPMAKNDIGASWVVQGNTHRGGAIPKRGVDSGGRDEAFSLDDGRGRRRVSDAPGDG